MSKTKIYGAVVFILAMAALVGGVAGATMSQMAHAQTPGTHIPLSAPMRVAYQGDDPALTAADLGGLPTTDTLEITLGKVAVMQFDDDGVGDGHFPSVLADRYFRVTTLEEAGDRGICSPAARPHWSRSSWCPPYAPVLPPTTITYRQREPSGAP